ncbi:unnamed protein product [Peronospora farinosa]|uniref:Uncharacterized protein n=1 Tax=Peronospora farinosa TaxID=134698 RepID=A0AAV0T615_9STRA|nr:unnamed protein product [Peronospora farinosa]
MVVKYADGKPRTHRKHSVVFPYRFDTFTSSDEIQVIDSSGSFDCIFEMPWLARHRTDIDWLNRTVQPRDIDVKAVLAVLDCPAIEQRFLSQEFNPQQWLRVSHGRAAIPRMQNLPKPLPKQRLPVRHEREVAPVSVHVEDTTLRQGPPASYAEAAASVRPVDYPVCVSVSRRRRRCRARHHFIVPSSSSPPTPLLETINVVNMTGVDPSSHPSQVASPPRDASGITQLPNLLGKRY